MYALHHRARTPPAVASVNERVAGPGLVVLARPATLGSLGQHRVSNDSRQLAAAWIKWAHAAELATLGRHRGATAQSLSQSLVGAPKHPSGEDSLLGRRGALALGSATLYPRAQRWQREPWASGRAEALRSFSAGARLCLCRCSGGRPRGLLRQRLWPLWQCSTDARHFGRASPPCALGSTRCT